MDSINIRNKRLWFSENAPIPSHLASLDFSGAPTITHSSIIIPKGVTRPPQQDAHVDAFRKWEDEWYGPQGAGPRNLGSGRCLNDELSEFYRRCAYHALVSGDKNMIDRFLKACWAPVNEQGGGGRLPAVNGDFVLTLKPHQE